MELVWILRVTVTILFCCWSFSSPSIPFPPGPGPHVLPPPPPFPVPDMTTPCPPPSPCLNNGNCTGSKWYYRCECPEQYAGKHCELGMYLLFN